MRRLLFFCFFVSSTKLFGGPLQTVQTLQTRIAEIKSRAHELELLPMQPARPAKCPAASVAFADIAKNITAVATAFSSGKCYEKHAELIGKINRMALDWETESQAIEDPLLKNGAIIEHNPSMVINIHNTQIQSVENRNSLIDGLFKVAKDKDCVENLKKKNQLGSIAATITKIGAIALVIPSAASILVGSIGVTLGGSLLIFEKIFRSKFNWKDQKERQEFVALNCAFYNLRTQLHAAGFFEAKRKDGAQLIVAAKGFLVDAAEAGKGLDQQMATWEGQYTQRVTEYTAGVLGAARYKDYALLNAGLDFLHTRPALGISAEDRFAVVHYFTGKIDAYRELFKAARGHADLYAATLGHIENLLKLSPADLLALSRKVWQLAYIKALAFDHERILSEAFADVQGCLAKFKQEKAFDEGLTNELYRQSLLSKHMQAKNDLTSLQAQLNIKVSNLERMEAQKPLDRNDDGMQNTYDILREYQRIGKKVAGKKGWSFADFLVGDAKDKFRKFQKSFAQWRKDTEIWKPEHQEWACRDAFIVAQYWDSANAAVELLHDFVSTNHDLWSRKGLGLTAKRYVPFTHAKAYHKLVGLVEDVDAAAAVIGGDAAAAVIGGKEAAKGMRALGKRIVAIKRNQENRLLIDKYRAEHCKAY